MEKTLIQRRIEQVVTNGRGYNPNNLCNSTNPYFSMHSFSGVGLALVNMDFRDGNANPDDVSAQVEKVRSYSQEIGNVAMYGEIGTVVSSVRKIAIRH